MAMESDDADGRDDDPSANRLDAELTKVIDYFRKEFHISYSEALGVLEIVKHRLLMEITDIEQDDEDAEQ